MMRPTDDGMACANDDCAGVAERDDELAAAFEHTAEQSGGTVVEADDEASEGRPTANEACPECDNDVAYYRIQQTASADEPPTRFLECTECGHRWRGYN